MKASCILKLALVGGLIYYFIRRVGSNIANAITFVKATLNFDSIDLAGADLSILLTYRNDNGIAIPIDSFDGFLMYGPVRLAAIRIKSPVTLAPKAVSQIPVKSRISFLDLSSDIINLVKSRQFLQGLTVTGFITVKGASLDVDYPIQIL